MSDDRSIISGSLAVPVGYRADVRRPWRRPVPRLDYKPWPLYFVWIALACQILLLFLGSTPLRLPLRMGTYGGSLALLWLFPPKFLAHPSLKLLKWVPVILAIGLIHPLRNTLAAGIGQIFLYIAIFAPVAWVAGFRPNQKTFEAVLLSLWVFNTASATMGVLQVYWPRTFTGTVSNIVAARDTFQQGSANVKLADGSVVMRPFGLTDTPGGAATGGLDAIVLGVGVCLTSRRLLLKLAAAAGMLIGLFAIILSQVRIDLIMSGVCCLVLLLVLLRRGNLKHVAGMGTVFAFVIIAGGAWAFAVGGKQTIDRISTLASSDPTDVYNANRGMFLNELIFDDIPRWPYGAGLGRWGMMNFYFGNGEEIWSEIIWTGWVFDGGVPLLLLYGSAFFLAIGVSWRIAVRRKDTIGLWAGVVTSYNCAALAGSFCFPLFVVQMGMEFWLINACLFSASLVPAAAVSNAVNGMARFRDAYRMDPVPTDPVA